MHIFKKGEVKLGDRFAYGNCCGSNNILIGEVTYFKDDHVCVEWEDGTRSYYGYGDRTGIQVAMPPLQEQKTRDAIDKAMKHDPVSKPEHYTLFEDKNIEVRDLMTLLANRLQTAGYTAMFISDYIQAMQYMLRFDQKNGKEDICKAVWYFNKMLESYPENKEVE